MQTFKFSKIKFIYISNRVARIKCPEKPLYVLNFFQNIGFSAAHIRSAVCSCPQILFSDIDKTLKPKIYFFQQAGILGSDLGKFISKNSILLTASLEKTLVPNLETLKRFLYGDKNNKMLIKILHKCGWLLQKNGDSKLSGNAAFLKSCGIVGSQFSMLLKVQPRIFILPDSLLRDLVSQAVNMGFPLNSRMLVHAIHSLSCLSRESFERKLELLQSFGFTNDESMQMFRRAPSLLRTSEEKLKFGIEFYLHTAKLQRRVLVNRPQDLMYSMEERVVPRYRVSQVIISKKLLKKEPSFVYMISLTEVKFLENFILRFGDAVEELMGAYQVPTSYGGYASKFAYALLLGVALLLDHSLPSRVQKNQLAHMSSMERLLFTLGQYCGYHICFNGASELCSLCYSWSYRFWHLHTMLFHIFLVDLPE
ncbi:Transcription termination factor like [Quillaja saponaria]|uniref:Transcription termination factor like n=1 Tax=Quillaja saponaria TaxID=32244 RepID=A0AAD7LMR1_QUISA|nr:Transcription termination factor like [Quillaja saponaria]